MSELSLTGFIDKILPEQKISDTFTKRELILETEEKYPQKVKIEFINSGINSLMDKKEGQQVKVCFNVRGREWNEKYFVSLNGWRIELLADTSTEPEPEEIMANPETGAYSDELPF
tara:strand:+ start:17 stop:364 length:348 start_codon:yes stop_codon:yes gene_type:complete